MIAEIENMEAVPPAYQFRCAVRIGKELERFVKPVAQWKKTQNLDMVRLLENM